MGRLSKSEKQLREFIDGLSRIKLSYNHLNDEELDMLENEGLVMLLYVLGVKRYFYGFPIEFLKEGLDISDAFCFHLLSILKGVFRDFNEIVSSRLDEYAGYLEGEEMKMIIRTFLDDGFKYIKRRHLP
jgi:hypothetical protein